MLGHDIAAALPELRAHAESNLTDLCRIERKTGAVTIDTANGMQIPDWVVAHDAVPCRVVSPKMQPQTAEAGEQMLTVLRHVVAVPVAVEVVQGSHAGLDGLLSPPNPQFGLILLGSREGAPEVAGHHL